MDDVGSKLELCDHPVFDYVWSKVWTYPMTKGSFTQLILQPLPLRWQVIFYCSLFIIPTQLAIAGPPFVLSPTHTFIFITILSLIFTLPLCIVLSLVIWLLSKKYKEQCLGLRGQFFKNLYFSTFVIVVLYALGRVLIEEKISYYDEDFFFEFLWWFCSLAHTVWYFLTLKKLFPNKGTARSIASGFYWLFIMIGIPLFLWILKFYRNRTSMNFSSTFFWPYLPSMELKRAFDCLCLWVGHYFPC